MSATGVIRVAPTGSKASPNVRYDFNGDRILCYEPTRMGWTGRAPAPNRSKATWAREEVQVEIAEQINLSSIKVG